MWGGFCAFDLDTGLRGYDEGEFGETGCRVAIPALMRDPGEPSTRLPIRARRWLAPYPAPDSAVSLSQLLSGRRDSIGIEVLISQRSLRLLQCL